MYANLPSLFWKWQHFDSMLIFAAGSKTQVAALPHQQRVYDSSPPQEEQQLKQVNNLLTGICKLTFFCNSADNCLSFWGYRAGRKPWTTQGDWWLDPQHQHALLMSAEGASSSAEQSKCQWRETTQLIVPTTTDVCAIGKKKKKKLSDRDNFIIITLWVWESHFCWYGQN